MCVQSFSTVLDKGLRKNKQEEVEKLGNRLNEMGEQNVK